LLRASATDPGAAAPGNRAARRRTARKVGAAVCQRFLVAAKGCAALPDKGDSEKQVAWRLRLSRHAVHHYIKAPHRHFVASSRGELLARARPYWPVLTRAVKQQ